MTTNRLARKFLSGNYSGDLGARETHGGAQPPYAGRTRKRRGGRAGVMARGRVTAALVMLAFVSLVPVAMADEPNRIKLPGLDVVDPPGLDCPEAVAPEGVQVRTVGPTSVLRIFDNGRQLLSGRHPDEFTNVATGESVVLHLQGSADLLPEADGSFTARLSGETAFTFFPGDVGPGDETTSRTYAFTGDVRIGFDASGAVVSFTSTGRMDDVCAAIA